MMRLDEAWALADWFIDIFYSDFERLEVAGSTRRKELMVKDLELVGIIKEGRRDRLVHFLDIFSEIQCLKPSTAERAVWPVKKDGKYWKLVAGKGVRLGPMPDERRIDLFIAEPGNFGWQFVVRTGPGGEEGFGAFCCKRWKQVGPRGTNGEIPFSKDGWLCSGGGVRQVTPEEADVFKLLHLYPFPPERRGQAIARPHDPRDEEVIKAVHGVPQEAL